MPEMDLLEIKDLYKQFNGNSVLKGINFSLKPGEVYAVVGGNGAGKSTLMKIITGLYKADQGEIIIKGRPVQLSSTKEAHKNGIYLVPQEPLIFPNMTIEENISTGMDLKTKEIRKKIVSVMTDLNWKLDLTRLGYTLSIAEQQLVEILRGLVREAEILILDEPTSTLTHNEISSLFETVKLLSNEGIGIIYITHRFSEIFEISNSIAVLRDGAISDKGPVEEFTYERLLDGLVSSKMKQDLLEQAVAVEEELIIESQSMTNGEEILVVEDLTGRKFNNVSLSIKSGEILGIAGVVGAGRTELAEAIVGIEKFTSGSVKLNGKSLNNLSIKKIITLGMAYVPEDRHAHGVFKLTSVRANTTATILDKFKGFFLSTSAESKVSKRYIDDLKIKTEGDIQEIGNLSGGNQQKVVLAKYLATEPKVIILDEPTRGIDASARNDIYRIIDYLKAKGLAVLLISSDTEEIVELSDRVIVMHEGVMIEEIDKQHLSVDSITSAAFGVRKEEVI